MRIMEIKKLTEAEINERVSSGEITEAMGKIVKQHEWGKWSQPMTDEEAIADLHNILKEAGVEWEE